MRRFRRARALILALVLSIPLTRFANAAIPSPEKLLPDDTLIIVTAPDLGKLRADFKKTPQNQFWNDPAMKPFTEKFMSKWTEEVVKPLERDLGIKLNDLANLAQGQATLGLRQLGSPASEEGGVVLLVDAKDKADQLKQTLAGFRKKWVEMGKTVRTEKIHESEFAVLSLSSNDVPKTLRKLFPPSSPAPEAGSETEPAKNQDKTEWVFGQVQSLLIVGDSIKAVEPTVSRLMGGSVPTLGELAAFQADQLARFRDATFYAWINAKGLMAIFNRKMAETKEKSDAPNPFDINPEKVVAALGLSGLKTFCVSARASEQGSQLEAFAGVPESSRQGLFKILAGEPKDSNPPNFVPAEVVKFQRWRLDGQKAWAALEKMVSDISPQMLNGINFLIDTANTAAKEKDSGFDIRKTLIGNLGDDIISYQKAPRGETVAQLKSPPSILLIGSPNSERFAIALKSLLGFMTQQAGITPEERDFLGRKVFSVPLRSIGLPIPAAAGMPKTLSFAASGGYVALSTDVATLEEYLRTSETQGKALKEATGLNDAAQKVLGPGSSLFGYENQAETIRNWFELLRKDSGALTNATGTAGALVPAAKDLKEWLDFSLLPRFEKVSKYFYFTVYGGSATADGLTLKVFSPVPPAVKVQAAASRP
ncbi:MAG TPA: hypothetical protein VL361_16565 [Candidatus Limnocylindrales bacterium]|nr:hypothetical protein [Candidatus Limnocylindrales bacterium]